MGKGRFWGSMNGWRRGSCTLSLLLALSACGSDHDDDAQPEQSEPELEFGTCPSDLPGVSEGRECAVTEVPLRWDEPDGESIDLLVARYASATPNHGQLWLLDGGPGGTGAIYMFEGILSLYASLGLDVYIPQHRGTGHSTPLDCKAKDDLHACGEELLDTWGDGLRGFHSVEAGRDLGHLIDRSRSPGERVFVLGISYGSYWAQRYMQSFPQQADGVILEGVFPLYESLWEGDVPSDAAARSIFQACREDAECEAAFGSRDPEDVATSVIAEADDPELRCLGEDGFDRLTLEGFLSDLISGDAAPFVPGLIRRLDRCSTTDQEQLLAFGAYFAAAEAGENDPSINNDELSNHVLRTDLMAKLSTFPLEDLLTEREPLLFWSGAGDTEEFNAVVEDWPVNYPPASTSFGKALPPVLLMNGGLDIQTPSVWGRDLAPKLGGTLVEFPYAGHGVDISLSLPFTAGDASCSLGILGEFIDDPHAPVDGACAATAYTPDLAGHGETLAYLASVFYGEETPLLGSDDAIPQPKRIRPQSFRPDLAAKAQVFNERLARAARR